MTKQDDIFNQIKLYLPKNLTEESKLDLFLELKKFPEINDSKFYTRIDDETIYQGDGIKDLLVINLPDKIIKETSAMVFSNTCDIDERNERRISANIVYSPIMNFDKYVNFLKENDKFDANHINTIRKQLLTSIFFLPKWGNLRNDSIVFLDRLCSCSNDVVGRNSLAEKRLFTLSHYGHYLFLLKLAIHFTRLEEETDRKINPTKTI